MTVGSTHFTSILRDHFAAQRATNAEPKSKGKGEGAEVDSPFTRERESSERTLAIDIAAVEALLKEKRSKQTEQDSTGTEYGSQLPFVNPFASRSQRSQTTAPQDTQLYEPIVSDIPPPVPTRHQSVPPRDEPSILTVYDKEWLLRQCEIHIATHAPDSAMSPVDLCTELFDNLRSNKTDDEMQMALVDLIGFENFELLTELLSNRELIVDNITSSATSRVHRKEMDEEEPYIAQRPQYGTQVTVMSEADKQQMKLARKEHKKKARAHEGGMSESANILGFDGDYLRRVREEQLTSNAQAPLIRDQLAASSAAQQEKYPHVYQSGSGGSMLSVFGQRFALPHGSERADLKDYEEISIPIPPPPLIGPKENRVEIASLDEFAQRGFKGYKSLNRVQSIVYETAYKTNENMLVCAPTGAGKTDVAMLTVLRTLSQNRTENGRIAKNDFKIVYVAPMKALAAEVVRKFSGRLGGREEEGAFGLTVKELTGDMQLTKAEIAATQMIVTTPEKWDVVTRKSVGDTELAQKVRLLIIDEVHLLHDDRGSVIESIVARTLRQVESSQSLIRIVGLSATLPNYVDVAQFLGVNPYQGLFFFDASFRPVPLAQNFIGVKGRAGSFIMQKKMNDICYEKVVELVRDGAQVMVFVHARKETVKTAQALRDEALNNNELGIFDPSTHPEYGNFLKEVQRSRNKELRELFTTGFGIHNAGMLRGDRTLTERLFEKGLIKVLCCTATLAWGVNLPAFAVVIKGTSVYDAKKGGFIDLSILDVLQIFGRAGRPQYEDHGVGYILTSHDKLQHYVSSMTQQHPIESRFQEKLADNLNAEISLGTVTNLDEAVKWLSYTYLYVRMRKNPFQYGLDWSEVQQDPRLGKRRRDLIDMAANMLHKAQMIVYDKVTGYLSVKDLGRTGSSFYIQTSSIEIFNEMMRPRMTEADVLSMVSMSSEFENIKVREEEIKEMKNLEAECVCAVKGSVDTNYGKTNILLQAYISRLHIEDFALVSDTAYVAQNAARILRALFEISLSRNWGPTSSIILSLCKAVDRRMWSFQPPLSQFDLPWDILQKLSSEERNMSIEMMRDMDATELGQLVRHGKMGHTIARCVEQFPTLQMEASVAPITRTVIRLTVDIIPDFTWNDKIHGSVEPWYIWVEDPENTEILYSEYFLLHKRQADMPQKLAFTIPIPRSTSTVDELPPQIFVRAVSDKWIGAETIIPVSFKHLILPTLYRTPHTDLLDLQPLPVSALQNPVLEDICRQRFEFFNPVQTQIFHTLYQTEHNVLVGAPTGSGKTVAAELAMWAAFRDHPQSKVVYIAPLKALVRERVQDWRSRLTFAMGRNLVELTGDVTPDIRTIQNADIIITTPEKWDGISRSWQNRSYVTAVSTVIIDEIHLLGGDRGPILEVIVSRMNYISAQTGKKIRIVGLSTALANASDLADWLGIGDVGLFNFRHSVRPVPLEVYIDGFPGKHYCPRMMSMNKPTYAAIVTHSPKKPVIVFVSSRRQTRLTAQDLMALCAVEENPKRFLHMDEDDLVLLTSQVKDQSLKLSLGFGIGLHHAGLVESDRKLSEELFVNGKIQILIATSTLAWGVNFPAHLVVIKGTEYYDAKSKGYVDFPITDVLQMMGRAGRPQFDDSGVARILVQDVKKNFYKKFLHEPFPVESSLHTCLADHLNAEIVGGTVKTKQDGVDYLTWTYLYRRLMMNPTFYGVEDASPAGINLHLSRLIEDALAELRRSACVEVEGDFYIQPSTYGRIASYYYLHHSTMGILTQRLGDNYIPSEDFARLLKILCDVAEYDELPVRHNEDLLNKAFEKQLPVSVQDLVVVLGGGNRFGVGYSPIAYDDPHVKAFLLLQAHMKRVRNLPCSDYATDTISVLDQSIRIMQAMVDVSAERGFLKTCFGVMRMMQRIKQGVWEGESELLCLPRVTEDVVEGVVVKGRERPGLRDLARVPERVRTDVFRSTGLRDGEVQEIWRVLDFLPLAEVNVKVEGAQVDEKDGRWSVEPGREYKVSVDVITKRRNKPKDKNQQGYRVHSPRFPKPQYEGWWVVLGDEEADALVALKRVAAVGGEGKDRIVTSVSFVAPEEEGLTEMSVYLVSDGYVGLDEEVKVGLNVRWGRIDV